ncbi:hypothetical protein [Micromonospora sp. C31]|uniref:hypothetical protein n=1 Tax=Micromonospora sp. C31 TaxID=2824876 RepID=UPI001FFD5DA2|nr:hypothetical protein [Micromonospora sp. C31]
MPRRPKWSRGVAYAELIDALDTSPLGSCAFAGTDLDIAPARVAELFGFDGWSPTRTRRWPAPTTSCGSAPSTPSPSRPVPGWPAP